MPDAAWGTLVDDAASEVFRLVNEHRRGLGMSPLVEDADGPLSSSANWKAMHMSAFNYISHNDPSPPVERTYIERISACGFNGSYWSENLAFGQDSPDAVMATWLASAGHRENIETQAATMLAVSCAKGSNGVLYWCQNFGG